MLFFKRKKPVQEEPMEKVVAGVTAENLSASELRGSRLPDDKLCFVSVTFTSSAGMRYQAVHAHQRTLSRSEFINLWGRDSDVHDFISVRSILEQITGGQAVGRMSQHNQGLYSTLDLNQTLTQERVADFAEQYAQHFGQVQIARASYSEVPQSAYENSGLPEDKLTVSHYK